MGHWAECWVNNSLLEKLYLWNLCSCGYNVKIHIIVLRQATSLKEYHGELCDDDGDVVFKRGTH